MSHILPPDFKQFTPEVRRVLAIAGMKAKYSQVSAVTTEHLLLGIFLVEGGATYELFKALNINLPVVRSHLEAALNLSTEVRIEQVGLTPRVKSIITQAIEESRRLRHGQVGTEHLLLALLAHADLPPYAVLTELGITSEAILSHLGVQRRSIDLAWWYRWIPVSPIFVLLLLITTIAGVLLYQQIGNPELMLAVFVMGGWLVTLVLHEFGHAIAALDGGDHSVRQKGYLTLNPFRYTHPFLSIVLPVAFVLAGGIGLPGGAVYIQTNRLRTKAWQSLVSAAGPFMTLGCVLLTSFPFLLGIHTGSGNAPLEFWAGTALLAYLQITSLVITLLPVPPLDGFGILAPYLPASILNMVGRLGEWGFALLCFLLLVPNPVGTGLWALMNILSRWFGIDPSLASLGLNLFRFWE